MRPALGIGEIKFYVAEVHIKDIYPVDGYYERLASDFYVGNFVDTSSVTQPLSRRYLPGKSELKYAGNTIEYDYAPDSSSCRALFYSICVYPSVYQVIPFNPSDTGDTYNINTRPTSITGGNYGIVGDNGQITKVEDNSTIVNETNNTFYKSRRRPKMPENTPSPDASGSEGFTGGLVPEAVLYCS